MKIQTVREERETIRKDGGDVKMDKWQWRGWREVRQWCGFHSEVMSCWSDNKLQMEAVGPPLPCVCVCVSGIYVDERHTKSSLLACSDMCMQSGAGKRMNKGMLIKT